MDDSRGSWQDKDRGSSFTVLSVAIVPILSFDNSMHIEGFRYKSNFPGVHCCKGIEGLGWEYNGTLLRFLLLALDIGTRHCEKVCKKYVVHIVSCL